MTGIIVGVDGSAASRHALEWAVQEAAVRHAPLTVLTVHQAIAGFWGGAAVYPGDDSLAEQARKTAQEDTDTALAALATESRPPSVTVRAVSGIPAEELLSAATDADMIIIGSRGAGGFARLLMGSVASQVAHHAHCPVTIVPAADRVSVG